MNGPLVSIIIPIYNVSDYVDACIESACRQSYANLEIILVDDGSPDDCPQKCDNWAEKDSRIKVIHKPNGGLSDARNAGLDIATGKYIYFLDGDDTIEPNLIETVLPLMEDGADMVIFHFYKPSANGCKEIGQYHEIGTFDLKKQNNKQSFIIDKFLNEKVGFEAWSRIYRRDKIEQYGLRFADNRKIFAEDVFFCLCYSAHAEKVVSLPDALYNYTVREDSIMGNQNHERNLDRMNELTKAVYAFFSRHKDCKNLIKIFPEIHHLVLENVFINLKKHLSTPQQLREAVVNNISDKKFFYKQLRGLLFKNKNIQRCFEGITVFEKLCFNLYLITGNYFLFRTISRIANKFYPAINSHFGIHKKNSALLKKENTFVIIGTEDYGNLGDHKIALSMISFVKSNFPNREIVEIPASSYAGTKHFLLEHIKPHHTILLAGGGNFGNIYPVAQNIREDVIATWPKNKKIIFPQTIDYSNDENGRDSIEKAKKLFTKENNVKIFAREAVSFEKCKEYFSCDVFFSPDIVLYNKHPKEVTRNKQILLCLRSDKESIKTSSQLSKIQNLIESSNFDTVHFDTQLPYDITIDHREHFVKSALSLWQQSELVITDRLHGMIFAAITGTPCIALSNYNHKVSGTYEIIKYLPYIQYAEKPEEIEKCFYELLGNNYSGYDNAPLSPFYEKLAEIIKG